MSTNPISHATPEEYLERERLSDERHEYLYGEIVAMARPWPAHGVIVNNVAFGLRARLESQGCRVFTESLRISVGWGKLISYPDVVLQCGEPAWVDDKRDTLTNPKFVVEVVSPSTADYDRGTKAYLYRMLSSMSEYLLIHPEPIEIHHWRRLPANTWEVVTITDIDAIIHFASLDCDMAVSEIYKDIDRYR